MISFVTLAVVDSSIAATKLEKFWVDSVFHSTVAIVDASDSRKFWTEWIRQILKRALLFRIVRDSNTWDGNMFHFFKRLMFQLLSSRDFLESFFLAALVSEKAGLCKDSQMHNQN